MAMKDGEGGNLVLSIWTEGGEARRCSWNLDLVGGRREKKRFTKKEENIKEKSFTACGSGGIEASR
jgi:hypothetical protein